jgi:hypothetical protein
MFTKSKVTQSMVDAVNEALKGDQHKIDANKNKKIDAQDFEILRSKKEVKEELKGDQHKIDANKNNKIDAHDFKILRKQKKETYGEEAIARIIETSHLNKNKKDDVPFTPDKPKKSPSAIAGKYGQSYSTVRHLARLGMKQVTKEDVDLDEARKLEGTYSNKNGHESKVYKLSGEHNEGDPYHVKLFKNGKHHEPADYFTNDKDDAHSTAKAMVKEEVEQIDESYSLGEKVPNDQGGHDQDVHYNGKKIGRIESYRHNGMRYGMHHLASGDMTAGSRSHEEALEDLKDAHEGHMKEEVELEERTLTEPEAAEKERIVKGMKKGLQGFKQRYGERAKSVMYATATKLAKEDTVQEGENKQVKGGDPCWTGYQMVGMKNKGGKKVPNCVPEETQCDTPMNRTTKIAKSAFEAVKNRTKVK